MVGLVDVEDVDKVVPGPGVHVRRLGVFIHHARAVLAKETEQGGAAGTAVEPDGERGRFGTHTGLEEPKEAERVRRVSIKVGSQSRRRRGRDLTC